MKYKKWWIGMLVGCLLTGCDAMKYPMMETIPESGPVKVSEYESQDLAVISGESREEATVVVSSGPSAETQGQMVPTGLHLTPADDNYKYEVAYRSGDIFALSEQQRLILQNAIAIVQPILGKSDEEKVRVVHDALCQKLTYGLSNNQYTAYGALVENTAVCQGYAAAFKLCMDLVGIDCITVGGTCTSGEEQETVSHAWNMVRLGEQWYHVDVTWDDPVTARDFGAWCHIYLLVPDHFMVGHHTWDTIVEGLHGVKNIPAATDVSRAYLLNHRHAKDQATLQELFTQAYQKGERQMELVCSGFEPDWNFVSTLGSATYLENRVNGYIFTYVEIK